MFPNAAMASLVARARKADAMAPPPSAPDTPRLAVALDAVDIDSLPDGDADALLARLLARRARQQDARRALRAALAVPFLDRCRQEASVALDRLSADLRLVSEDLDRVRAFHISDDPPPHPVSSRTTDLRRRALLVSKYHENVKGLYFEYRRARTDGALDSVLDTLVDATSVSSVSRRATIHHVDIMRSNHKLISSIEFNAQASIFATAGVTRRIKVFDFATVVEASAQSANSLPHCPMLEIPVTFKLSCLSWSHERASVLAASTYKGDILVHDTETNIQLANLHEHDKRAWFVDFSRLKPSLLLSGSDDQTVKLWDVRTDSSSMTLRTDANVCCVKFNPEEANEFAFASADHNVYSYDMRHPNTPLCVFEGHWRAVSHVVFLNRSELVSASTDSSCKLWNVEKQQPGLSYAGHTNERNFIGLCASKQFFACGSEDNAVYVYHKGFAGPVLRYGFGSAGGFVSTVTWKPESPWLVAATDSGNVEILELQ